MGSTEGDTGVLGGDMGVLGGDMGMLGGCFGRRSCFTLCEIFSFMLEICNNMDILYLFEIREARGTIWSWSEVMKWS